MSLDAPGLVRATLLECWKDEIRTQPQPENDFTALVQVVTKIAIRGLETRVKLSDSVSVFSLPSSVAEPDFRDNIPLDVQQEFFQNADHTVKLIDHFLETYECPIREIWESRFPFSHFPQNKLEQALQQTLINRRSFLQNYLELSTLDLLEIQNAVVAVTPQEIGKVCYDLWGMCARDGEVKAGYLLLWLIKIHSGASFEIPTQHALSHETFAEVLDRIRGLVLGCFGGPPIDPAGPLLPKKIITVLNKFVQSDGTLDRSSNFLTALYFRNVPNEPFLYQMVLDETSKEAFIQFTIRQLQLIPMAQWRDKTTLIFEVLKSLEMKNRKAFVHALAASSDQETSLLATHLSLAFEAPSLREALPHFYALQEKAPFLPPADIELLFEKPFLQFKGALNRLNFEGSKEVFVYESLMVGVYDSHSSTLGSAYPPYLLAFDKENGHLVWGIPLILPDLNGRIVEYELQRVGDKVFVAFEGEKLFYAIDLKSGNLSHPYTFKESYLSGDQFHFSEGGFAYQLVQTDAQFHLYGGSLGLDGKWMDHFESQTPAGTFLHLQSHVGFKHPFEKRLTLFGPTGHSKVLENCMQAEAVGDTLYLLERDPDYEKKTLLTVRSLLQNQDVVSEVKQSLWIPSEEIAIQKICQNGKIVLFSKGLFYTPIFVDLNTSEIHFSTHRMLSSGEQFITDEGEVLSWDRSTKKITKISSHEIKEIGTMDIPSSFNFVHAENDVLYHVPLTK